MIISSNDKSLVYFNEELQPVVGNGFSYRCYKIGRHRIMNLWGTIRSDKDGAEKEVEYLKCKMPIYCLKVEKIVADTVVESAEFLCGLGGHDPINARKVIEKDVQSGDPVSFDEIEILLEIAGLPNSDQFDYKLEKISKARLAATARYQRMISFGKSRELENVKLTRYEVVR